jgi:hypothetical protein
VILLQVESIELGGDEIIIHVHFQGPNMNQNKRMNSPRQGHSDHYQYLNGHVYLLHKNLRAANIVATVQ